MSFTAPSFRQLGAAAAAALMFSSSLAPAPAIADAPTVPVTTTSVHPITLPGNNAYVFKLSQQLVKDTGDKTATLRAGGFAKELEAKLKEPSEKPRLLASPDKPFNGQIVITAVIPPQSMYQTANIPVCVEGPVKDAAGNVQNTSQMIATYYITPKGEVVSYKFNGQITTATQGFAFACRAPMLAARAAMIESVGQNGNGPAVAAAQPEAPSAGVVAALAQRAPATKPH
jgi:hypothetical protein